MTTVTFDETAGIGLSARLWKKMALPYGPGFPRTQSGNPCIGMYDEFLKVGDTTLEDGYIRLTTASGTVVQIASENDAYGIVRLTSTADNDEAVIQLGNGLDVGAFRASKELIFEARVRLNAAAIVADDHGYFIGMATGGASGCAIANQLFTTGDAIYATADLIGFQHLDGESTALDAMYQASGETKQDGAVNTDLDTIHTLESATWVKLGFRVTSAKPRRTEWYVDGVKVCALTENDMDDDEFPDGSTDWLQPTIGMRGADTSNAYLDIDWWACAQLI